MFRPAILLESRYSPVRGAILPDHIQTMQKTVALDKIMAWLSTAQSAASVDSLDELGHSLEMLGSLGVTAMQRLKLLDLFLLRATQLQATLTIELIAAALPLPADLRLRADRLVDAFGLLARNFVALIPDLAGSTPPAVSHHPAQVVWLAMQGLRRQLQVSVLASAPPPAGLWQRALHALRLLQADQVNPRLADEFNRMLALAVVEPESFTACELVFLIDYLQATPSQIIWLDSEAAPPPGAWWLDPTRDQPPHALARRRPPHESSLFFFDCAPLAHQARMHLAQLADGTPPATLGLPSAAADDYRNILTCAANRWSGPGKRQQTRHLGNYRVEICASAGALWDYLGGDGKTDTRDGYPLSTSDWLVTNVSAGGYALFHVAGPCTGMRTGTALGLRQTEAHAFSICLVRWAKSANSAHIELGLELVATTAQAVRLAHRGTPVPVPALLLPAQPALQRGETLLTARGQFKPGVFTLLAEDATGIRVYDCETGQLVTHTSSIEIFEFSRRPPQAAI